MRPAVVDGRKPLPAVVWLYRQPNWQHSGFLVTFDAAYAKRLRAQGCVIVCYRKDLIQ